MRKKLDIVIFGLSVRSSWANGHATTYRALIRALQGRGHQITFYERDLPWHAENADVAAPPGCDFQLYTDVASVMLNFRKKVTGADLVMVGSCVPEGDLIGDWVVRTAQGATAFFDMDAPLTLELLECGRCDYLTPRLVPRYQLYLTCAAGPTARRLEKRYGASAVRPFYCAIDPKSHKPRKRGIKWDLAYLGTYCEDRQAALEQLLLAPAKRCPHARMAVAGALYPEETSWPRNVERIENVPPKDHAQFFCSQRFALNLTREPMKKAGYSPSVRLFEAAACGVPVISDAWPGMEEFFRPGKEILVARTGRDVVEILRDMPEKERLEIGRAARARVLNEHTAARRVLDLERCVAELRPSEELVLPSLKLSNAQASAD